MLVLKNYYYCPAFSDLREADNSKELLEKHYYIKLRSLECILFMKGLPITLSAKEPQAISIADKKYFAQDTIHE